MLLIYKFLTFALYPFFIILIYIRKFFNKEHNKRFKEKIFSSKLQENKNKKRIWVHAASIGEIKSIITIVCIYKVIDCKYRPINLNQIIQNSVGKNYGIIEVVIKMITIPVLTISLAIGR